MKKIWLFGGAVVAVSLFASVWSYRVSLNRAEPQIAEVTAGVTTNPFNLSGFTKEGKLKVYNIGSVYLAFRFIYNNQIYDYQTNPNQNATTAFSVKSGETVNLTACVNKYCDFAPYGWLPPTAANTRNCKSDTDPVVAGAQAAGEIVVSVQCWQDESTDTDPYDDFEIVITQLGAAVLPSPSPSPSASPSPSPAVSPQPSASPGASAINNDQAQFVIRKFNDSNKNGVKDEQEGSVKKEWLFKVSQNADPPYDYTVDADSGEGRTITVGKGTKVTVEEVLQPGWGVTTDKVQVKNLTESRLYRFDFGNNNGAAGAVGPSQPDTGAPTGLTLSLALSIIVITIIKFILKAQYV